MSTRNWAVAPKLGTASPIQEFSVFLPIVTATSNLGVKKLKPAHLSFFEDDSLCKVMPCSELALTFMIYHLLQTSTLDSIRFTYVYST